MGAEHVVCVFLHGIGTEENYSFRLVKNITRRLNAVLRWEKCLYPLHQRFGNSVYQHSATAAEDLVTFYELNWRHVNEALYNQFSTSYSFFSKREQNPLRALPGCFFLSKYSLSLLACDAIAYFGVHRAATLEAVKNQLSSYLSSQRKVGPERTGILFVAHSLGGIIGLDLLHEAYFNTVERRSDLLGRFNSCNFLALGSPLTHFCSLEPFRSRLLEVTSRVTVTNFFFPSDFLGHAIPHEFSAQRISNVSSLLCNPIPFLSHMAYWRSRKVEKLVSHIILRATIMDPSDWFETFWGVFLKLRTRKV